MMRTMRTATLTSVALLATPAGIVCADESLKLDDDTARINYSLGYQIGGDFKRQGVEMNSEVIIKGIEDALSGAEPLMPPQEMNATLMELKRKVVDRAAQPGDASRNCEYVAEGKQYMERMPPSRA